MSSPPLSHVSPEESGESADSGAFGVPDPCAGQPEPETQADRPPRLGAFRHHNYRLFYAGQGVSLIGTWMQSVAQSWLIYRLTGSSLTLGLVGFAGQFPVFVLSLLGGAVADSGDRRSILVRTQAAAMLLAFVMAALVLSGLVEPWHIFVLAAGLGLVNAFDIPTRQSFVVEMVGREDLGNAIALNASMFNTARMIGPVAAGALVALVGEGWCFLLNGLSFLAVIAVLRRMRLPAKPPRSGPRSSLAAVHGQIMEGVRYAWADPGIRTLLLLLALVSAVGMPYSVLMPVFADKVLGGGAARLGLLMGSAGVGALLAAVVLALRREPKGLHRWIWRAGAGFGVSLILFSLSRLFWLSAALLVPVGFCTVTMMAASNTLLQQSSLDTYRGRIMSLFSMMFMGMAPVGAVLAGALSQVIGAPATVGLGGSVCLVAALAMRPVLARRFT